MLMPQKPPPSLLPFSCEPGKTRTLLDVELLDVRHDTTSSSCECRKLKVYLESARKPSDAATCRTLLHGRPLYQPVVATYGFTNAKLLIFSWPMDCRIKTTDVCNCHRLSVYTERLVSSRAHAQEHPRRGGPNQVQAKGSFLDRNVPRRCPA